MKKVWKLPKICKLNVSETAWHSKSGSGTENTNNAKWIKPAS